MQQLGVPMENKVPNKEYAPPVTSRGKDVTQTFLACLQNLPEAWTDALIYLSINFPSFVLAATSFNYRKFKTFCCTGPLIHRSIVHPPMSYGGLPILVYSENQPFQRHQQCNTIP